MATCSVRYEPHLSDKARSSEASRFSITKIWYVYVYIFPRFCYFLLSSFFVFKFLIISMFLR